MFQMSACYTGMTVLNDACTPLGPTGWLRKLAVEMSASLALSAHDQHAFTLLQRGAQMSWEGIAG